MASGIEFVHGSLVDPSVNHNARSYLSQVTILIHTARNDTLIFIFMGESTMESGRCIQQRLSVNAWIENIQDFD